MAQPRTIAYLRLATEEPEVEQDKACIVQCAQKRGLDEVEWIEEGVTGKTPWQARPIAQVLAELQPGDYLLVSHLSHLGRTLAECLEILSLAVSKQICVYAAATDRQLDPSLQPEGLAQCLALAADIERTLVSQRVKRALTARKSAGLTLGRPTGSGQSKLDKYRAEIEILLANGSSQKFIAHRYGTTEANLSRWMTKHELKRWGE